MIEYLPASTSDCLVAKFYGTVTSTEYRELVGKLESAVRDNGSVNVVLQIFESEFQDREAVLTDPYYGYHDHRSIGRAAFVGDPQWNGHFARLLYPFTRSQEHYFTRDQLDEALQWACSKIPKKDVKS